jgi:hypothetical protein
MSPQSSNISALKHTASLGGVSLIDFMRQWDLSLWHHVLSPTAATMSWTYESAAGNWKHDLRLDAAPTEAYPMDAIQTEMVCRTLCHTIINALPPALLPEVAESISDIYRSYLARTEAMTRRLALPSPSQPIQGKFGDTERRRPLSFSDQL